MMQYNDYIKQYRTDRREAIILEAAQLFLTSGIEPVKMTDIAEKCQIGVASLYRYFGTKTGIVIEAGVLLWSDLKKLTEEVYTNTSFREATGAEQIRKLLNCIVNLFDTHRDFLRFVGEFDSFVKTNHISPRDLRDYEQNVLDFYPVFLDSWQKGCCDGSIRRDLKAADVYYSVLHALLSMIQKFLRGEILESDDFSDASKELKLIVEMTLHYISTI